MSPIPPSICVFCGSRPGHDGRLAEQARLLGDGIAAQGWRLVYGAGDVGLMGEVARAAIGAGAPTFGVIPTHLMQTEQGKRNLATLVVTETMHERKKVMFANSDAIVVLPGGAGTLDEFFEVLTWAQLGLHRRPILLVNCAGFWDPLVALIDHMIAQGFAAPSLRGLFNVVPDAPTAISLLQASLTPERPVAG